MFERLSPTQREIVNCPDNRIVVKACPGSGKTFSVTARPARLLNNNELNKHQGISAISFTHTVCDEIRKGIQKFGKTHFGLMDESRTDQNEKQWVHGYHYVRDLVHGKYLINKGAYRKGLALIERGYHKMQDLRKRKKE
ncbi:MAG: UvrD-helicase domain-containing protein [Proteiniphilum sp.]|nr:UvrD-helicase domain-containing protein [Proteiniphilum sp.]MDD4415344.1 UvrD-helicase domain-containing protein [Proteiniphilum sp.]